MSLLYTSYEKEELNAEYWKNKYLKLLEEYNEIFEKEVIAFFMRINN